MSKPPPGDDGNLLDEILRQVDEALGETSLGQGAGRDALIDGVREAFSSLGFDAPLDPGNASEPQPSGPPVEVVQGGRGPGEPQSAGTTPSLRIAQPVASGEDPVDGEGDRQAGPAVTVRVVRAGSGSPGHSPRSVLESAAQRRVGTIKIGPAGSEPSRQTIFRGAAPHPYRIFCEEGRLEVAIDGRPADHISSGQSMDVEAGLIRVSSASSEGARGSFVRLKRSRRDP